MSRSTVSSMTYAYLPVHKTRGRSSQAQRQAEDDAVQMQVGEEEDLPIQAQLEDEEFEVVDDFDWEGEESVEGEEEEEVEEEKWRRPGRQRQRKLDY